MAVAFIPMHSNHRHSFLPQAHMATTSTASQQQPVAWQQEQDQALPEDQFTTLFCRALYDYDAQDASALSFRRNDIIEVLSQEPSGWWDGLLGDERGWFPSNYVDIISEEELSFLGSEFSNGEDRENMTADRQSSMADMSHAIMRGANQAENEEWLNTEMSFRTDALNSTGAHVDGSGQSSDFWMPRITDDAQIYYVNTRTGQQSRDLPQEADDEISDSDLAGLASQSNSRSGASAGLAFGPNGTSEPVANGHGIAGFGVSRRTGTPEPWMRKLADDGMSYFYYNKLDGQVQWTRPEVQNSVSHLPSSLPPMARKANGNRNSVYSDDSDVQPSDLVRPSGPQPPNGHTSETREPPSRSIQGDSSAMDFTSAERIARSLQQALSPSPPALIIEILGVAKSSIQEVVKNIKSHGLARRPEEDQRMDGLLYGVVSAVRNLLYTSAVPTAQIPTNVLPREIRDSAAPAIVAPLKSAHRKVTATLSRLVLSARAIQYDSGSVITDTLSRIEVDAEELERAVLSFVLEVQRPQHTELPEAKPLKRLHGVFLPTNLGLGLLGAGAAGHWKGFGWVHLNQTASEPHKVFSPEVISDMNSQLASIDDQFKNLVRALQTSDENSVEQLRLHGREVVARVSSFLVFAADIHVARHVDIDGIGQEDSASSANYMHTVDNARLLVRTLEAVFQSIYDDCSVLLLTVQSVRDCEAGQEKSYTYEYLDALSSSLSSNLRLVVQTLDSLLSVGHDQAEMALGEYTGSIDWRMSRISMRPIADSTAIYGAEAPDVADTFGNQSSKMSEGEPPYQSHARSLPNGLDGHNGSRDFTDETLVDENHPADVIRDANSSPLFEDDLVPNKTPPRAGTGSNKLARLLGKEYEEVVAADLRPWYLRSNFNPAEILIDTDRSVKGGTLSALVEHLTTHEAANTAYISYTKSFLMTYKSFTTVDELFDLLVDRFRIPPPANMTPSEHENWAKHKQHFIQTRVLNTFKSMVTDEDVLEKDDVHILTRMKAFVASEEVSRCGAAKPLSAQIERAQRGGDPTVKMITNQGPPPPPIIPRANKKLKLTDIEPLELARQLTIMESNLYQKIKPLECLQRAREQKTESMDNIAFVIQTSNRIADWVAESVLSKEDSRKRANVVKHLIGVADRCRTMNNFSTMIAITSGLNTPPIRRLKRTWEQVNQRCMAQFGACEMTIDSSKTYAKYSQLMASVTPPCVPFIGVFLSTLQFIQDGNPDTLPGGLVNFQKRQLASKVIDDIKRWQAASFNLQPIPAIQTWIEESLNQFNDTRASSEHFWALSLEREPREREDEKMARLLQESGFL